MQKARQDFSIWISTFALVLLGIVIVFSASSYMATIQLEDPYYYFKKQIIGAVLGFFAMFVLSKLDYHIYRKFKWAIVIIPFVMLLAVQFIPGLGVTVNGSSRWLNLGFITIQPSEIAKFALVVFLAIYLSDKNVDTTKFVQGMVIPLAIVGAFCLLIYLQPNMSMVVCIAVISLCILFIGGVRLRNLIILCGVGMAGGIALIFAADYRIDRLTAFLNPWADPLDSGYQLIQSFYAIASGGLFGKGIGMSQQKLMFLPFGESDFIFSVYAEEFGFIGAVALLLLYLFLIYRCARTAIACKDKFGSILAGGVTALLAVQVVLNVAVVTGCIPPTGQTLPFISAGSSSLVMFMAAIGAVLNVSKNCVKTG